MCFLLCSADLSLLLLMSLVFLFCAERMFVYHLITCSVATVCGPLKQDSDLVNWNTGTASERQIYGRALEAVRIQFCF